MNKIKKIQLTAFIKKVQSTIKQVGEFAYDIFYYVIMGIGIGARVHEMVSAQFNMPISFYTDTALYLLVLWVGLNCVLSANSSVLGAGLHPAPFS